MHGFWICIAHAYADGFQSLQPRALAHSYRLKPLDKAGNSLALLVLQGSITPVSKLESKVCMKPDFDLL